MAKCSNCGAEDVQVCTCPAGSVYCPSCHHVGPPFQPKKKDSK